MKLLEREYRETAREYAIRVITYNIESLQLTPGMLLSENELAAELGVSRTPVREALIELLKTKAIEVLPQRGSRISYIDIDMLHECLFIRETLECAIVKAAAEIDDSPVFLQLEENIARQQIALNNNNLEALRMYDRAFHKLLFDLAGKSQSYIILSSVMVHLNRIQTMGFEVIPSDTIVNIHISILDAIKHHDADKASEIMQNHIKITAVDSAAIMAKYPEYFKHM